MDVDVKARRKMDVMARCGTMDVDVMARCGQMDVDVKAFGDGSNALRRVFRFLSNSAFEGPLPEGRLRRFSRVAMIGLASGRLPRAAEEGWKGSAFRLVPDQWRRWFPKQRPFDILLRFPMDAPLFA